MNAHGVIIDSISSEYTIYGVMKAVKNWQKTILVLAD